MEFEEQEEHDEEEEEMVLPGSYEKMVVGQRGGAAATAVVKPRYRECLKNHAVGLGGHAVDGCGEFMAAGTDGTLDALKCAACNCHRNFHRKENPSDATSAPAGALTTATTTVSAGEIFFHHHQVPQFAHYYRTPAGFLQLAAAPVQQRPPLALPSTSGGGQSREDQEDNSNPSGGFGGSGSSRKRFRTKFSQEQKERMLSLAERLGWRIQKHDEEVVQQFCNEYGLKRHVLKVWMHNNKHTLGKKP